jgi:hypothetical protein
MYVGYRCAERIDVKGLLNKRCHADVEERNADGLTSCRNVVAAKCAARRSRSNAGQRNQYGGDASSSVGIRRSLLLTFRREIK